MASIKADDENRDPAPAAGVTQLGPERWHRLKELFAAALALPRAQRAAFVAGSCGNDAELHVRILELIRAAEGEDGFIEQSATRQLD
jgi:hypothetical protein